MRAYIMTLVIVVAVLYVGLAMRAEPNRVAMASEQVNAASSMLQFGK